MNLRMMQRKILAAMLTIIIVLVSLNIPMAMAQDISVRVLLEPSLEADFVYPFHYGAAAVRVNDAEGTGFRLGYVNRYGQLIIPFRAYPNIAEWQTPSFSHGLVSVYSSEDNAIGFFDASGGLVIPFIYDRPEGIATEFAEGLAPVSHEGLWGFIDTGGTVQVPFTYERAGNFSEGLAPIMQSGRWGFINTAGDLIIPFVLDNHDTLGDIFINPGFSEGVAPILLTVPEGQRWGFLHRSGNRIASNMYLHVEGFSEGRALVMSHDEEGHEIFGFVNRDGVEVIPLTYSAGLSFSGGLAAVRNGQWGFIDHDGSMQIPIRYDEVRSFAGGFAAVKRGEGQAGRWGFIDRWGNEVVPLIYNEVRDFSDGLAAVRMGEGPEARWGFVDQNGNVIVPIEYLEAHSFSEALAWVRGPGGWGILLVTTEAGQNGYENGQAPVTESRYVYYEVAEYLRFTPANRALDGVYDATSADEAIFGALRALTPEQRGSGDALNIAALFIENAIRRGTSQDVPEDGMLRSGILQGMAQDSQGIWQEAATTIAGQNVNFMRPLGININFISHKRDAISLSFPDEVSSIAFDNLTVEASFASVTINRGHIRRGDEIVVLRGAPVHITGGGALAANFIENHPPPIMAGFIVDFFDDFNLASIPSYILEYWAVAVVILLIIIWGILASMGHRLRIWVVPTFSILAIATNLWMLGLLPFENRNGSTLPQGYFYSIVVTMSPGLRATISIPLNGANPDSLVLYNERGEPQLSKYNPVTNSIDARIRAGGTFTLRQHNVSFEDIGGLSPLSQRAIVRLASMGIMNGSYDNFRPTSAITRAELIMAIVLAFDLMDENAPNIFPDNTPDDRYYHAIATAGNLGLIHSFEDGNFRGSWAITKQDIVLAIEMVLTGHMGYWVPTDIEEILARYQDRDRFEIWSESAIALATAANVLIYRDDGLFATDSVMSRGDAAIVVYRLLGRLW